MRFTSTAFAFALLGSAVQALPIIDTNGDIAPDAVSDNLKRQASGGGGATTKTIDSDNIVTTSKSQGTTDDRTGYSWRPVASTSGLLKERDLGDKTVINKGNIVTVSKSQGTTEDRKGYSWRPTGL